MEWSGLVNTQSILRAMTQAADAGAQLCVFPELAVTGFHRQIRNEAVPSQVQAHLQGIQHACVNHSMTVVVGSPTFGDEGRVFNSYVFIDEQGNLAGTVEKMGLTPAEETFFARGSTRSAIRLRHCRSTAILCREIDDLQAIQREVRELKPEIIFWPGAMRPAVDGTEPDPQAHVKKAQQLAQGSGAFIVQANWPNSLNYPDESEFAGQSVVISPDGEILVRLPTAAAGVGVFELGQTTFEWFAQADESRSL